MKVNVEAVQPAVGIRKRSKWEKLWNEDGIPLLMILPPALLFLIFFYVPLFLGFWYSLTDWNGVDLQYNFIAFDNYMKAFTDERFWNTLGFTFQYALIVSVLINVIGLSLALLLNQEIKCRNMFRGIFFFPAVLSLLTIGYIFNNLYYLFVPKIGHALGIEFLKTNILGNEQLAMWGIVFVNVWQGIAITIVIYLAGLQAVPKSIYESAKIDGVNAWQNLTRITLPLIIPAVTVNSILTLKGGLMVFDYIIAMTNGGPGKATEAIALFIYNKGFGSFKLGYGSAVSIILFLLFAVIAIIQISYLRKREVEH